MRRPLSASSTSPDGSIQPIAICAGDLAALPLLKRFGVTAAARASCYTETTDLDRLAEALHELTRGRNEVAR